MVAWRDVEDRAEHRNRHSVAHQSRRMAVLAAAELRNHHLVALVAAAELRNHHLEALAAAVGHHSLRPEEVAGRHNFHQADLEGATPPQEGQIEEEPFPLLVVLADVGGAAACPYLKAEGVRPFLAAAAVDLPCRQEVVGLPCHQVAVALLPCRPVLSYHQEAAALPYLQVVPVDLEEAFLSVVLEVRHQEAHGVRMPNWGLVRTS